MTEESDIQTHVVFITAFIQKGAKFLLAKRAKDDPQAGGVWATPGGKVDLAIGDDVIETTIKREISEEVGLQVSNQITYLGSDGFIRSSGHHVVGLIFLAKWKSGVAKPLEDQEDICWYTLKELYNLPDIPKYFQSMIKLLGDYIAIH